MLACIASASTPRAANRMTGWRCLPLVMYGVSSSPPGILVRAKSAAQEPVTCQNRRRDQYATWTRYDLAQSTDAAAVLPNNIRQVGTTGTGRGLRSREPGGTGRAPAAARRLVAADGDWVTHYSTAVWKR